MSSWRPGWSDLPGDLAAFWTERHLCTLTTLRPDGSPHVVPVGVALDPEEECAWIITSRTSRKVRNVQLTAGLAACQVDGRRWSTLEGEGRVLTDRASVARAEERYASRYRVPRPNRERVAIRVSVDRFLHSSGLVASVDPTPGAAGGSTPGTS
ncbi:TIGR03618 family F420-dependent PPOX class oxidoreductase [Nocardioides sp. HDW12B]|uniref:pyridoxamine 5'-phosphate oxidase family protein n=1 Tax=Nocardioides sp. HDW12B TaxID=2714939 RepID=UPI00140B7CD1|nr:TIGR03618 family F420-dependent PPOX class oxidoreductase [Nocardioides sp. HDW12B]QIK65355.1 TIGR03618 family F420-dependent PPOX class oxidoreductase [Nocardioides sp. HDW12B]